MTWQPNRRQFVALGGAAASVGLIGTGARAQSATTLRVGAVFPSRSGATRTLTSITDFIGEGARQGALLAEGRVETLDPGLDMLVLQASAPTPEAAIRATERLIELEEIDVLLGGVGDGQLEVMTPLAESANIPLFNVGTQADAYRNNSCSRHVFHVEASDAMYLDAMIAWSASQGHRRWFVVHEDNPRGFDMRTRVLKSIEKFGQGGEAVGGAATQIEQPIYLTEIDQARRAEADSMLVLLSAVDQIAFFGQLETSRFEVAALPFPDPVTQTRDYVLAIRQIMVGYTPVDKFQLWDPTIETNGGGAFNEAYAGRFAGPADPTAWSAYSAAKIYYEAVRAVGSKDTGAVIEYLESGVEFDVFKGPGTSFRPWDHQLRQPLYRAKIDIEYDVQIATVAADLPSQLAVVNVEETVPAGDGSDPIATLDQYGDGPEDSTCRF